MKPFKVREIAPNPNNKIRTIRASSPEQAALKYATCFDEKMTVEVWEDIPIEYRTITLNAYQIMDCSVGIAP